jgi:hypothetical protein
VNNSAQRVTGIGGVFFTSQDPERLASWYREHLGIDVGVEGYAMFQWREKEDANRVGATVWAIFPDDTD